jgi:hypothetical protein
MLSHLTWFAAAFFYLCLAAFSFSRPNLSGDNAMGYGLGLFFFGLCFAGGTLALAIVMLYKGRLDALLPDAPWRSMVVVGGALALVAATFFSALLRWEQHHADMPAYIYALAEARAAVWLPLLALAPSFFLLSEARRLAVPALAYQIPLALAIGLSFVICAGLLKGWFVAEARQQQARLEQIERRDIEQHERHLRDIEAFQPTDNLLNILSLTGRFHDEAVRTAAVAKVRSHPNWEGELLALLEDEYYYHYAYTFLDGNLVDHPELFAEPLRRSILLAAAEVRRTIKDANNLQSWSFDHLGIERLLRAIDEQFSSQGVDYRPALRELRQALDTPPPERFAKVRYTITPVIDRWLEGNNTTRGHGR